MTEAAIALIKRELAAKRSFLKGLSEGNQDLLNKMEEASRRKAETEAVIADYEAALAYLEGSTT